MTYSDLFGGWVRNEMSKQPAVEPCEQCDQPATEEVAGRDATGTLWVWWVCDDHRSWAEQQRDVKVSVPL